MGGELYVAQLLGQLGHALGVSHEAHGVVLALAQRLRELVGQKQVLVRLGTLEIRADGLHGMAAAVDVVGFDEVAKEVVEVARAYVQARVGGEQVRGQLQVVGGLRAFDVVVVGLGRGGLRIEDLAEHGDCPQRERNGDGEEEDIEPVDARGEETPEQRALRLVPSRLFLSIV